MKLIDDCLLDLAQRRIRRLIVSMPPRHGKSELISHWLPVWYLEMFPDHKVMLTSYEAMFAADWGRRVRNTIEDNTDRLTVRVSPDSRALNNWRTTAGGGMVTSGVGGPIAGRGCSLLICDDLIKNWREASSPVVRENTWNWFLSTAYTRLEPDGIAVMVATRWHTEDPPGRLLELARRGGENWHVISLPAIAESGPDEIGRTAGEALWPARFPLTVLERIRGQLTAEIWDALYQQRPMFGAGRGRVYKTYTEANLRELVFDPRWPLCLCCDFNVDPMIWLLAQDTGQEVFVLREIVIPDARTADAIRVLHAHLEQYLASGRETFGPAWTMTVKLYGDAAGGARTTAGISDWAQIREYFRAQPGFRAINEVPLSNPHVKDRVEAVNAMLCNADGVRRLFIDPGCRELILDFERVTWKPGTVDIDKRTEPYRTHASDALGYMIHREYAIGGFQRVVTRAR